MFAESKVMENISFRESKKVSAKWINGSI